MTEIQVEKRPFTSTDLDIHDEYIIHHSKIQKLKIERSFNFFQQQKSKNSEQYSEVVKYNNGGRFLGFSSRERTQRVPFCQEIRDFIAESHKRQTFYANFEGSYSKRVMSCRDKKLLQNFIFNSLYYNENIEEQSERNSVRKCLVESICDKMISLSRRHNLDDEIHFSVVWVFYFDYELKVDDAMAVFKIFKKKSGSEAVFLDSHLKSYESWDCYLENAKFKDSFLCVPRHGEYIFDDKTNMLVLEYVRSLKPKTEGYECPLGALPFSLKAIRPLFTGVTHFVKTEAEKIIRLRTLYSYLLVKLRISFSNAAAFIILLWKKIKESQFFTLESISNAALMLLNIFKKANKYGDLLMLKNYINCSYLEMTNDLVNIYQEGTSFLELLSGSEKDWFEILKSFCNLCRKSSSILFLKLQIAPSSTTVKCLFMLLNVIEIITEGLNHTKLLKCENDTPNANRKYENRMDEFNSSHGPTDIWNLFVLGSQHKLPKAVDFGTQTADVNFEQSVVDMSLREILSNLPLLEQISANSIHDSVLRKSSTKNSEKVHSNLEGASFMEYRLLIGKQNGYGIYLFPEISFSHLTQCISKLLKTDITIKPKGTFAFEITSCFGKTLGFVFFPSEFSAVGFFPVEVIGEVENALLL